MYEQIFTRFELNLNRVRSLIEVYEVLVPQSGRAPIDSTRSDLLRSAVVFLHATLEDLLRSLAFERLPSAAPEVLAHVPVPVDGRPRGAVKVDLAQLAQHRGKSVDGLIADAVEQHLERSTYNNVPEVNRLLTLIGIDSTRWDLSDRADINAMMTRRHQIVHRVDQSRDGDALQTTALDPAVVKNWLVSVERLGEFVTAACEEARGA